MGGAHQGERGCGRLKRIWSVDPSTGFDIYSALILRSALAQPRINNPICVVSVSKEEGGPGKASMLRDASQHAKLKHLYSIARVATHQHDEQ
jgi:hypothetical protein